MTPKKPENLKERAFSKTIHGYNPAEVDDYIRLLLENYTLLYQENLVLQKKLQETAVLPAEEILQNAKQSGEQIICEASLQADDILAAAKANCDSILLHFRERIEAQKKTIAEMQQSITLFKNELFEQYRLHIEWLEKTASAYDCEEELAPEEYIERVVEEINRCAAKPISAPDCSKNFVKKSPLPTKNTKKTASCTQKTSKTVKSAALTPPSVQQLSIMELICEYEKPHRHRQNHSQEQQFMLDFENPSEAGVLESEQQL